MGLMNAITGNASKVDPASMQMEYGRILFGDEAVYAGYILYRDAIIFTDRRLILVDKQGVSGKKIDYHSIPYRSITHFSVETAGTWDLDAELKIWLSGMVAPVEKRFNREVDIYEVQGILSAFVTSR